MSNENSATKKVKSIAFQLADPMEYKLYYHALSQGVYFSTYIKRLIQRDIEGGGNKPLSIKDLKEYTRKHGEEI